MSERADAGWPAPLAPVLAGRIVRLEPLERRHAEGLRAAARPPEIWTWLGECPAGDHFRWEAWIGAALQETSEVTFATVDVKGDVPIGMTRFMALRPQDRSLEIGWTWLTPSAWRTGANVEAKLLQLTHAFERLGCIRVELKTHAANERSRAAILALGATFEGVHRKHRIIPGLGVRDTAWFSIVDDEWPAVRDRLRGRLAAAGYPAVADDARPVA